MPGCGIPAGVAIMEGTGFTISEVGVLLRNLRHIPVRIVVTGSRGKSSLTRLLQAGLSACGLRTYARITGVIPRELSPSGERAIRRTSPAGVREMHWWLSQVTPDAQAVVVENSAVSPSLQAVASDLAAPTLIVWTTLRADHVEVWGPGREGAALTLIKGVPFGVPVVGEPGLASSPLSRMLAANGNILHVPDTPRMATHTEMNLALAVLACSLSGVDAVRALPAMASLPPDIADFRILRYDTDELAVAFSANDVESTEELFGETGWTPAETTLLYHHRPDREARLENFLPWIEGYPWKERVFTRQYRTCAGRRPGVVWNDTIDSPEAFCAWHRGRGRVFACGNVAGWPIEFLEVHGH